CADAASACGVDALTLVDDRDGTFSSLTMPPYRLLFSCDVKIYENASVLPRAFLVGEWQWVADSAAAVAAMRDEAFDPARTAVIVGNGERAAPGATGAGNVAIIDYAPESVRLRAVSEQDALLILTDAYYPGWSVTVDGAAAEVLPVDGMFRGVFLPAGAHDVVFHYRPESFRVGAAMSLSGVALAALAVVWLARNRSGR
ncbi:MAG TPA: YfhO family protein, partial [Promineifilum sp.]|nr:YfhO family protein [Promineifilum sp.]